VGPISIADDPEAFTNTAGAGTLDSPGSLLSGIEINAGEEGTNAAIRVGSVVSRAGGFQTLSLTAGAPLDKDTGTTFSLLDPFANGVFLEGRYTFTRLLGRRIGMGQRADEICEEVQSRTNISIGEGGCREGYIRENAPARYREFEALFWDNPTVMMLGFRGRIGRDQFKFLEPATGAAAEVHRTPWMLGASLGFAHLPSRSSFSLEVRHQTRFKAATTAAVCPGTPGVVVCPVGPVGPPSERDQTVLSGEFRRRLGSRFAIAIRGSFDFAADIFELDVPVYFIGDGNLGLNAGVRARYVDDPDPDDENEGLFFGIFISKSFSLF
jgi:hypothetical protein